MSYPAAYDKYCIAVGATRFDETRSYYSNAGSYLDIDAPGGDTNVDQNGDGYPDGILQQTFQNDPSVFNYYFFSGTSMATPHVTGTAALLVSRGVTDPNKVRLALEQSAKDLGPAGWDKEFGWGLLNVFGALSYKITGDLTGDLVVGFSDLSVLSDDWLLQETPASKADVNKDGIVNLKDYAIMINNWDK